MEWENPGFPHLRSPRNPRWLWSSWWLMADGLEPEAHLNRTPPGTTI